MSKSPQTSPRTPPSSSKFCSVINESVKEARKRRRKPQPWVIRKIWILVTLGIMGYAGYAYIARLCTPMIMRKWSALGSRTTGIVLLIFFSILFLWMIWAYSTVILTDPGYARDHIVRTERPPLSDSSTSPYYGHSYQDGAPPTGEMTNGSIHSHNDSAAGPLPDYMLRRDSASSHPFQAQEPNAGVLDTIVQPPQLTDNNPHTSSAPSNNNASQQIQQTTSPVPQSRRDARRAKRLTKDAARNSRLDEMNIFRKPSSTPILQPVFRYCDTDELIRPHRAHHCRACGTCVLKYDHHCPWIGQCVGARNHKFFFNFCLATSIFTAYVFASVLFFIIRSMRNSEGVLDPQFIVLLALAALFWLFTTALSVSHMRLITLGQTTVESMQIKAMQEKEDHTLERAFEWWQCGAKRKRKKRFDEEWGSMNTEGNIWWRGSAYKEWIDVMGKNWLGWIFPIGSGLSDGLSYPINPRFDSDGRLRKRTEWPEDLR